MTGPPERERRPGQGGAESRGGRRLDGDFTPPPPDHDYDEKVTDPAEVVTTDPLTADEWGAICLAEARDLAEVVE